MKFFNFLTSKISQHLKKVDPLAFELSDMHISLIWVRKQI